VDWQAFLISPMIVSIYIKYGRNFFIFCTAAFTAFTQHQAIQYFWENFAYEDMNM
jgi:hypothetical protein